MAETSVDKRCETCRWWKKDYGIFTFTGWTGTDRDDGSCRHEPKAIYKSGSSVCARWESDQ